MDEKESIERVKEGIESLQETEKHYSCVIKMAAEKKKNWGLMESHPWGAEASIKE